MNDFKVTQDNVDILAMALKDAFLETSKNLGVSLKCFDWLSYRPDYWHEREVNYESNHGD